MVCLDGGLLGGKKKDDSLASEKYRRIKVI